MYAMNLVTAPIAHRFNRTTCFSLHLGVCEDDAIEKTAAIRFLWVCSQYALCLAEVCRLVCEVVKLRKPLHFGACVSCGGFARGASGTIIFCGGRSLLTFVSLSFGRGAVAFLQRRLDSPSVLDVCFVGPGNS